METVKPDYNLIKRYLTRNKPLVSDIYFKDKYRLYSKKPEYNKFIRVLEDYGLTKDNNLYFFWVYFFDSFETSNWAASDTALFKVLNVENKELEKLKDLIPVKENQTIKGIGGVLYKPKTHFTFEGEQVSFHSAVINLTNAKGQVKKIKITSDYLLSEMFEHIHQWSKDEVLYESKIRSKKTYLKKFVRSTNPLFKYLKDTCFKAKPNELIYEFIEEFLNSMGAEIPTTPSYIKDCYR